jgi:rod shape-determining protein MreC
MPVIAYQNGVQALVGKVVETGRLESLVMPLYDTTAFVSARFARSRSEGIVEGQGDSDIPLIIRFVSKRARNEIQTGDIIITSGMGGIYPPGINIGRISGMHYREDETSMELELQGTIDFSKLEYVFAIDAEAENRE